MISDSDIEAALLEILGAPDAPIPTPGLVFRHLSKRMNCCGCASLAVDTIYNKVDAMEKKGLITPCLSAAARSKLLKFSARCSGQPSWSKTNEPAAQVTSDDMPSPRLSAAPC
jgi:hypothetical protein